MNENEYIVNHWKKREKPAVPANFFETFYASLWDKIQEGEDQGILGQLKKSKRPEVPEGYFDQPFSVPNKTSEEEPTSVLPKKRMKPSVPAGFFEEFETKITEKVQKKDGQKKKGQVIRLLFSGVAVAAMAVIGVLIYQNSQEEADNALAENPESVNELEDSTEDLFLTYLDEDELIDFIIENEVDVATSDVTVEESAILEGLSEEELEDYYLGTEDYLYELEL